MSFGVSLAVAVGLWAAIFLFTAREISVYRSDQRNRSEIYPYTRRRLRIRCAISGCLAVEVLLLALLSHTLHAQRPRWFLLYVGLVLLFAGVMVLLALLDWKESRKLMWVSEDRLYREFLHEIGQGIQPPPKPEEQEKWH